VPPDRSPRQLQRVSMLIPVEQRSGAQEIADRRFISLSDVIREAIAEKIERAKREDEVDAR